jgi:hypothetical protein
LNLEKYSKSGKERFGTGRKRNCFDANSKAGAIVNEYGFTVLAKVNDTLVFKSDIQI